MPFRLIAVIISSASLSLYCFILFTDLLHRNPFLQGTLWLSCDDCHCLGCALGCRQHLPGTKLLKVAIGDLSKPSYLKSSVEFRYTMQLIAYPQVWRPESQFYFLSQWETGRPYWLNKIMDVKIKGWCIRSNRHRCSLSAHLSRRNNLSPLL